MAEATDAAALTAVVVAEEEARRDAQAAAEAGELLPDDLLPGVGGDADAAARGTEDRRAGDDRVAAARQRDRDLRQRRAPDARARHPEVARREQDDAAGNHVAQRRRARALHAAVRLARRPLRTARRSSPAATTLWSVFIVFTGFARERLPHGHRAHRRRASVRRLDSRSRRRSSPTRTRSACARGCSRSEGARSPARPRDRAVLRRRGRGIRWAAPTGGAGRWWRSRSRPLLIALSLFFLREPGRGRNEQEAVLGHVLGHDDEPPVRLSSVSARLKKVKTFRYLTLGIGMLGFALVSVPSRLELPVRGDVPLRRLQARVGAVAHLHPGPRGDPDRRPLRRPPLPPRSPLGRAAVRLVGHRVRRVHHGRQPARPGRAADRASSRSRTRSSSRRSRRSGRSSRRWCRTGCGPRRSR